MNFFALIDYDNVADLPTNRRCTYRDHSDSMDKLIDILLSSLQFIDSSSADDLIVRLYGGWHDSESRSSTPSRELLGSVLRNQYPIRTKRFRIRAMIADALIAFPSDVLPDTVRPWRGFPPFRVNFSEGNCHSQNSEDCRARELEDWRRGRCPHYSVCQMRTSDVVNSRRQKLVDTSIVADMITISTQNYSWVAGVSNDDDIIPGVLAAWHICRRAALIRIGRKNSSPYDDLLRRESVPLIDAEAS